MYPTTLPHQNHASPHQQGLPETPPQSPMPSDPSFDEPPPSAERPPRRIVVTHRLPLRADPDAESPFGFTFSLDPDALPLQLARGLPNPVTFVGTLPATAASVVPSAEIQDHLLDTFSCLPVFIPADVHAQFYDGFCKHYLWPQLHYLLPLTKDLHDDLHFEKKLYNSFVSSNRSFADRVLEVLSPDDGDLVFVHDYHLWLLPTFLRLKCPQSRICFFLHSPFPSTEHFRSIPVRENLLRALLNADLVGFHTFDYASHFFSACSRILGLSYHSRHGRITINYHGRAVLIKILSVGIDMVQLRAAIASPEAAAKTREIFEKYSNRMLIVGVDDTDIFKGVSLKLLALEKLLETHPAVRSLVVLVQINNPARSHGRDVDSVRVETDQIRERINARFGGPTYQPVVMINRAVPLWEKVAYYTAAECCVVSAVRDGLNRIPYFYTVCRQDGPVPNGKAGALRRSAVVLSEFVGCSPSMSGAIRVNPWNVEATAEAMHSALTMHVEEKHARHKKHYNYLSSHDIVQWARSLDADLQLACKDHSTRKSISIGFGMSSCAITVDASFQRLTPEHADPAYQGAGNRLILLDYDGTLVPEGRADNAPTDQVIGVLNDLCSDPSNVVFVVSGRGKDELAGWFTQCEKLGIAAEHGYFTRWCRDDPWETSKSVYDSQWKELAEAVMGIYTETTDGSYIEAKETAMVWHYQDADPKLGPCQAKELLDHLMYVLAREPVFVRSGRQIVEVNTQGVRKGIAAEKIVSAMARRGSAPEFILCVGDDQSDEDMFESVAGLGVGSPPMLSAAAPRVFACTVGNKPSVAKYYLNDPEDVVDILRALAYSSPSRQQAAAASQRPAVAFELGPCEGEF